MRTAGIALLGLGVLLFYWVWIDQPVAATKIAAAPAVGQPMAGGGITANG